MSIYEVHLGSWMRKPTEVDKRGREIVGSEFYNYREIAVKLAEYVKEMGYTHVELLPSHGTSVGCFVGLSVTDITHRPAASAHRMISCILWIICTDRNWRYS